jgi:hypothetical protein
MTEEEVTQVESPLGRVLQAARDCNSVAAEGRMLNEQLRAALDAVLGIVGRLDGLADNIADLRRNCPACAQRARLKSTCP